MRRFAVLIDLSGTLHIDDTVIDGAIEAVRLLRMNADRIRLKFVTNTTKESIDALHTRLDRIGFDIRKEEIFTSMTAARRLIEQRQLRPLLLVADEAIDDFNGLLAGQIERYRFNLGIDTSNTNAVVIGLAPAQLHYERLTQAFRLIVDGAQLIAIHKARYYRRTDGLALGPGPFVCALEYAANVKAEIVGKPEKSFFLSALADLDPNISPMDTVMIGDDVRDDIAGANDAGMKAILVQTGKYRPIDNDHEVIRSKQATVVANVFDAVRLILDNQKFFDNL